MLRNCDYNKVKLMHDLSGAAWFLKQFCHKDAQKCCTECKTLFAKIQKDLEKSIEQLHKSIKE